MAGNAFHKPFRAKPTEVNGITYGSKAEARRAGELELMRRAGKVAWVLRQVPFDVGDVGVDLPYKVDFLVGEEVGPGVYRVHAEDVKSIDTLQARRRFRQWAKRGPVPLHVIKDKKVQVIEPGGDAKGE